MATEPAIAIEPVMAHNHNSSQARRRSSDCYWDSRFSFVGLRIEIRNPPVISVAGHTGRDGDHSHQKNPQDLLPVL